jgi:uncharacterized protein YndB with AHSA1/START domain
MAANAASEETGRELVITRVFDAPRKLVFEAWTDPKHVAVWWGPHGFTNPVCEWDARPGGKILIHMRPNAEIAAAMGQAGGFVLPMTGLFHEVVEPERLVFTTQALDGQLEVLNTVTLEEQGCKTKLTLHVRVTKATPAAAGALAGMEPGWTQSLERLESLLSAR